MDELKASLGIPDDQEWDRMGGLSKEWKAALESYIASAPFSLYQGSRVHEPPPLTVPADLAPQVGGPSDKPVSTQAAFGAIMLEISKYFPRRDT